VIRAGAAAAAAALALVVALVAPADARADGPTTTITSGPASPTNQTSATFAFDSPGAVTTECSLDGGAFALCGSGQSYSGLAEGSHTFAVHGTDILLEQGPDATYSWTIDTTPPTLTVPASFTVETNGASATVTYTATSSEGAPSCSPASGASFPLGTTTVTCTATDAAGNSASASFQVTVADSTPPTVSITSAPTGIVASRSASVSFTASDGTTTCRLDGGAFSPCSSPATYSGLADGAHAFVVHAQDASGNSAEATAEWTVDATPPTLSLPGSAIIVEADGPTGATATYVATASDGGTPLVGPAFSCSPRSGAHFPLGDTTVDCRATDPYGNVARGSFHVIVRDTTPPTINAPNATLTATSPAGIRRSDPDLARYLAGVTATDLVSTPRLTNDARDLLPVGMTVVTFTATDAAGNTATRRATVTVLAPGKPAPKPDLTPPANPTGLRARAGDHRVALTWRIARDVVRVSVSLSVTGERKPPRVVFDGPGRSFVAKGLRNGVEYRFLLVAWDRAGNRSRGAVVRATPHVELLGLPKPGQRVASPPLLRWAPVREADYFNVQLWHGKTKILSAWPSVAHLQLTRTWVFEGKRRTLEPGVYRWYVWPGLGDRAAARYGALLGSRTFVVVKRKPKPAPGV
jgi:hypothetical protein